MITSKAVVKAVEIQEINEVLINRFVKFLDVAPLTVKSYTSGLKQYFSFLNNNGIKQPDRNSVIEFKKYLADNNSKNSTIALYLSAVKRFFSWSESEGLYPNITAGIKAPKIDKGHKKDAFSGEQVKEILAGMSKDSLKGLRDFAMLGLIATTGLRTIEVVRANVEDLRLNAGVPVLYVQGKGKTSKADFVKITPKVLAAIQAYLKARGQVKASEPLFVSHANRNNGGRLTTRTVSGVCKKAFAVAGYISSRLTAHSLRHSAITISLMAGQSLQEVQAFARHSNIATTTIYAHNVNRLKSQCENLIEGVIF